MKNLLFLTLILYGCSPLGMQVAEDILEGEASTIQKVQKDMEGSEPTQRAVKLKLRSF